jgi:hypothetical protein
LLILPLFFCRIDDVDSALMCPNQDCIVVADMPAHHHGASGGLIVLMWTYLAHVEPSASAHISGALAKPKVYAP